MSQGIGAPHASFARSAVSTPAMKSVASCTPREVTSESYTEKGRSSGIASPNDCVFIKPRIQHWVMVICGIRKTYGICKR